MGCHASCLSYVELFANCYLIGGVFVVLYKIVTFHNAACVCDDGQTGAASSHTRTLQCVSSSQSLFRCIKKKKRVMVRRGLHHLLTQYKGFLF